MTFSKGDRVYHHALGQWGTVLKEDSHPLGRLCDQLRLRRYTVQFDCGGEPQNCLSWDLVAAKPTPRPALRLVVINGMRVA